MHGGTPTGRDPSPAARVGYHSGSGLATTFTRRIDATLVFATKAGLMHQKIIGCGMEAAKQPAVYILASRFRGTLYVGVTSALWSRLWDHKNGRTPGFTSRYRVNIIVWYEHRHTMVSAIAREKQIKAWKRAWKIELIEKANPHWRDLHEEIDPLASLVDD